MFVSWKKLATMASSGLIGLAVVEVLYVRHSFQVRRNQSARAFALILSHRISSYLILPHPQLPPSASGPTSGLEIAPDKTAHRKRHIVFLGDSTVTGVGCSKVGGAHGPVISTHPASPPPQRTGKRIHSTASVHNPPLSRSWG